MTELRDALRELEQSILQGVQAVELRFGVTVDIELMRVATMGRASEQTEAVRCSAQVATK